MNIPTNAQRLELRQQPLNEYPVMKQKWRDLLFLHWEYDALELQKNLPAGLYVDTFDNRAYVGITPFFMFDVRPVMLPSVPAISDFKEVNVRTYVHDENGVPGVWFFSLDANQPIAVQLARQLSLPYHHADIKAVKNPGTGEIIYRTERERIPPGRESNFRYKKRGDGFFADSDSLEFFLVERYLLYTYSKRSNKIIKGRIYHLPYPLFEANVEEYDSNLIGLDYLNQPTAPPDHIIYSSGVDVDIYLFKSLPVRS